ncbi:MULTISPECIES: competence protein CoiA [Bacillus]|uniref:Competence CoiA-like predicted nuclease n=1 Tax=Bacillus capparidis TaxID=1840411 RepID=A0ABS4CPX6_9BACI|nr:MULTISPECIES: competence protein CoiA family protein [Bacillus]MBP1079640.1 competence CoiA-like predicted nuclease [Bacillus capparidis]
MLLSARRDDQQLIYLADDYSSDVLKKWRTDHSFYCPVCKEQVDLKLGQIKIFHFSHKRNHHCPYRGEPESDFHLEGKRQLYRWLIRLGEDPELEPYLPAINQRPDLLLREKNNPAALEFQCSPLSYPDYKKRTSSYIGIKIEPVWIIGANRLKRVSDGVFQISDFLRQFSSYTDPPSALLFYCPNAKAFIRLNHMTVFSSSISCAELRYIPLKRAKRDTLQRKKDTFCPPESWPRVVRNFRLKPKQRISKEVNELRLLYYEKLQVTLPFLPSEVFLPLSANHYFSSPVYIWQSYIYLYLLSRSVVTAREIEKVIVKLVKTKKIKIRKMFISEHTLYTSTLEYLQGLAVIGTIKEGEKEQFITDQMSFAFLSMEELLKKDNDIHLRLKKNEKA